jgi:hypothetical protein
MEKERMPMRPTFIRVGEVVLDNYRSTIEGCVLLRLSSGFTECSSSILRRPSWRDTSRYAENMAREELFRARKVGVKNVGLTISRGKKDFGRRNQKDLKNHSNVSLEMNRLE